MAFDPTHDDPTKTTIAVLAGQTLPLGHTLGQEGFVLTGVFSIRGNEEFATEWSEAFSTDRVCLQVRQDDIPRGQE